MANYFTDGANGNDTTGNGSLATPWKTIGKFVSNGYAAGDTLNIQAASTYAEAVTFTTAGTAAAPITIRGYSAAAGDLVGTTTYPTITPTSVSGTAAFVLSGAYNNLQNINIQHSVSGKGALSIGAGHIDLSWCRFSGASSASKMNAVCVNYNYQNYICMSNCLIENVDNSNKGIDGFYSNEFLVNTTIRNCGYGVLNAGPANSIIGCNIYGCNSYGMNIQSGAQLIVNCNISDNGGSGISNNSGAYLDAPR